MRRSDDEMMQRILTFARQDDAIRAVYMNGSRANPNVPKDIYQDFDIVYVVRDVHPYIDNKEWISYFGEICVMQEPDNPGLFNDVCEPDKWYAYLMQFTDGHRIDLRFLQVEEALKEYGEDTLTIKLLDKDNMLPELPASNDREYWVKRPTEGRFRGCCNEFWWVTPYIAKGLARNELLYAMDCLNDAVRPMLLLMLEWYVGLDTDFSLSVGKCDKYIFRYLPQETAAQLAATYPRLTVEDLWRSVDTMMDLFDRIAKSVGQAFGYEYVEEESVNVRKLLKTMRKSSVKKPELWDAYYADGSLAGMDLVRDEAIPEGLRHGVVEIIVMHKDGSVLVTRRDQRKKVYPGYYECSGGGVIKGETFLEGAKRELREETGICVDELTNIYTVISKHTLYKGYVCVTDMDKDAVVLQEGETIGYKWLSKEEFASFYQEPFFVPDERERLRPFVEQGFQPVYYELS